MITLFATLLLFGPAEDAEPAPLPPADPAITREAVEHHVRYLAAHEREGRAAMTPQLAEVRDYLVRALTRAGVEPAGDGGGWTQEIALARWGHTAAPRLVLRTADGAAAPLEYRKDFQVFLNGAGEPQSRRGLRVRRVLLESDLPEEASSEEALLFAGNPSELRTWCRNRGYAVDDFGLLLRTLSPRAAEGKKLPESTLVLDLGDLDPIDTVGVRGDWAEMLSGGSVRGLDLEFTTEKQSFRDYNVVGRIAGRGTSEKPELAEEAVVLSAHLDGLGTLDGYQRGMAFPGPHVVNGANDDASGMAALLEIAEALAAGEAPARTVVLLFTTLGRERNLGGEHYIRHPAAPLEATVLNLHLDRLGRPDLRHGVAGGIWVPGSESTNLQGVWFEMDLPTVTDMRGRNRLFRNRGSWVFARRGIVAHPLTSIDLTQRDNEVNDDPASLDYDHLAAATRTCYAAARSVIDAVVQPEWTKMEQKGRGR